MSGKAVSLLLVPLLASPALPGCDGCPTGADRVFVTLLDTSGVVAPGEQKSFDVNNGIRSGNLVIVLTWSQSNADLELVATAHDCDPATNGACRESRWISAGSNRIEAEVDASSIPRYTITVVGSRVSTEFSLTVTFKEAICT